jgi:hypothetical protein
MQSLYFCYCFVFLSRAAAAVKKKEGKLDEIASQKRQDKSTSDGMNLNDHSSLLAQARSAANYDSCRYAIHFPASENSRSALESIRDEIQAFIDGRSRGFIWNHEDIELRVADAPGTANAWIEGNTVVGDSVEDEWFIVWLLREVSKRWPDAVIR